jgi:hypothetical protein
MNAVAVMAASAVDSSSVTDYELTKPQMALFAKFDDICRYLALANKKPPNIRLKRTDWVEINNKVVNLSAGKRSLATVTYKGYPILSATE